MSSDVYHVVSDSYTDVETTFVLVFESSELEAPDYVQVSQFTTKLTIEKLHDLADEFACKYHAMFGIALDYTVEVTFTRNGTCSNTATVVFTSKA